MKIMPPGRDSFEDDASLHQSSPIHDMEHALHQLLGLQYRQPTPLQLDSRFQLPKFASHINGDLVDSWIRNLSTYFNTFHGIIEDEKLKIASLQMEGVAQAWWDTQLIGAFIIVDLQASTSSTPPPICTWEALFQSLHSHFYPLDYHQGLLACWL